MSTLYEISDDMHAITALLEEAGGDITDEQAEEAIDQWLAENKEHLKSKLDGYGMLMRNRSSIAEARKAEATRLAGMAKVDENFVDRMKGRLLAFFKVHNLGPVETDHFKFWKQKNGGLPPLRFSEDVSNDAKELPEQFVTVKTTYAPNADKIREVLNGNDEQAKKLLEGLAWIEPAGEHLRIK